MTEHILKDQQTIWTFKDYASLADWIGVHKDGVTLQEVTHHFNGCGPMRHRLRLMCREGIIVSRPMVNGDPRIRPHAKNAYIQLRRIEPKDKPLPRGKGKSMLAEFSAPLQRPSEMNSMTTVHEIDDPLHLPMPVVDVEKPTVNVPDHHTVQVVYSNKRLQVLAPGINLTLNNVNLKLDLS